MALFGGTGTGKSTLLANMAASDLAAGTGITVVDPHGGLYDELLSNHIPRYRKNDVILRIIRECDLRQRVRVAPPRPLRRYRCE